MSPYEPHDGARRTRARRRALRALIAMIGCASSLAGAAAAQAAGSAVRPYGPSSPWNTPIPDNPAPYTGSGSVKAIVDNGLPLSADPDQFTLPVYTFDANTPLRTVRLSGFFSSYDAGDNSRVGYGSEPTISNVPVPANAVASEGSDGQVIIWNPDTGVEYGFFRLAPNGQGGYTAQNGYRYHTTDGYGGRFADGLAGRGAGTPYLAGLVRPWEIDRGRIDHALAFSYSTPSNEFVFPASKSDGTGSSSDLPEGTRLQLDPSLTSTDFAKWGLSRHARIIAKALQQYGMYIIDVGGSSKIYVEDRKTAGWGSDITRDVTRNIPLTAFRAIAPGQGAGQGCTGPTTAVASQGALTKTTLKRLTSAITGVRSKRLRTGKGPLLRVKLISGSAVRARVMRRINGKRRLLARGSGKAVCGRVQLRLRPTKTGRRHLHRGRRVTVELRLRTANSNVSSVRVRTVRLRRR